MRIRVYDGDRFDTVPGDLEVELGPEAAVAFDRDVPEPGWTVGCEHRGCLDRPEAVRHLPVLYKRPAFGHTLLTDGHGHGYVWHDDPRDPLGGRWSA